MAEPHDEVPTRFILDPPAPLVPGVVRYAVSAVVVVSLAAVLATWAGRAAPDEAATEIDDAVIVDLPPAEASSQPASEAPAGPEQQAAEAAAAQPAPPAPVEPPRPDATPDPVAAAPPGDPPPPVLPDPPAVLEPPKDTPPPPPPPPPPVAAPPLPAQEALAPPGSQQPTKTEADDDEEGKPPPSSHAITLWQKSLMHRLEAARREIGRGPHGAGTVKVAFEIDARGALAGEHVARSSGSSTLDAAAMLLIRRAAPFPAPPVNAANHDTSFVVPIRFR